MHDPLCLGSFISLIFLSFVHVIACINTAFFLWKNITPLYGCTTFCLSTYQLMNIWGFYVLAVRNSAAMSNNISIYEDIISTSLGYLSRNGIAGSHVNSIFKFVGTTNCFPSCCTILHPHQQSMWVLIRHIPGNGCYCL